MHHKHLNERMTIPIVAAPPNGEMTESLLLEQLVWKYGPVLNSPELRQASKVSKSSAGNLNSGQDESYPKGFPLFDSVNSPRAYFAQDVARWLFERHTKHINSKKVNHV